MDNIRNESFLGSNKIIVGDKYTDLVLETLGKVYIKTGNSSKVLSDVLALLDKTTETEIQSQTIIVGSTQEMEEMEYPGDGFFIYNTLTTTLYIAYDNRYVALIEAIGSTDGGYVRRKGDTMTGQLEINTVSAPLIVASSKLVKNFNAEYLDGYAAGDFTKRRVDEYIYGNWTFKGTGVAERNWTFKDGIRLYGDLVTSRSITSPEFFSGFGGYGWRIDADTNTLTIDYLVVRKAMRVFELVINKISATNGSLWVSNSSKCESAKCPIIITESQLSSIGSNLDIARALLTPNNYYLPAVPENIDWEGFKSSELSSSSTVTTTQVRFTDYKFIIYIQNVENIVLSPLFQGAETLYDEQLLTSSWETFNNILGVTQEEYTQFKSAILLHYISKEKTVTKWNDTTPVEWIYSDTFNKTHPFYIIPSTIEPNTGKLYSELYEEFGSAYLVEVQPFYRYFALKSNIMNVAIAASDAQFHNTNRPVETVPNLWIVETDKDEFPTFKPGDIIRCQKYSSGNIKYYDALVMAQIGDRTFTMMKATSVFDTYTEIDYNADGSVKNYEERYNNTQYNKTEKIYNSYTGLEESKSTSITTESRVDDIMEGDDMIQMGNIYSTQRQNAIYLTSCDDQGPYIDIISELNRPDYSVLYDLPLYQKVEYIHTESDNGYRGVKYKYFVQEVQNDISIPIYALDSDGNKKTNENGDYIILYWGTLTANANSLLLKKDNKFQHRYSKTTMVRLGNLSGIYNEVFGKKQPYGFGLYGENVFLTGEFYLNNGQTVINFSEDQIMLKFKMAGIIIQDAPKRNKNDIILGDDGTPIYELVEVVGLDGKPVLDESGNKVYRNKTEIIMQADQMLWQGADGSRVMQLVVNDPDTGEAMLDLEGNINAHGLYIYGKIKDENGDYISGTKQLNAFIDKEGNLQAKQAYFEDCYVSGTISAHKGSIGQFSINNQGLYSGDPSAWYTDLKQNLALIAPGYVRIQSELGYGAPGNIANMKVGLGIDANPTLKPGSDRDEAFRTVGYFYRQMNDFDRRYIAGVSIISDNVVNRDVALAVQGAIVCNGGIIEYGHKMNIDADEVNVLDLSFGSIFMVHNHNKYRSLYLPSKDDFKLMMKENVPSQTYSVRVTIAMNWNNSEHMELSFKSGDTWMYFRDNHGNEHAKTITMAKGDVIELLLVLDGDLYFAHILNRGF